MHYVVKSPCFTIFDFCSPVAWRVQTQVPGTNSLMSRPIVDTVMQAIDRMLSSGAKSVIITSTELESTKGKLVLLAKNRNGKFLCLVKRVKSL